MVSIKVLLLTLSTLLLCSCGAQIDQVGAGKDEPIHFSIDVD